eukprot:Pgem_evm1s7515
MLDFSFFVPKNKSIAYVNNFFEPYWLSNSPKFGEKGSNGWVKWLEEQDRNLSKSDTEILSENDDEVPNTFDVFDDVMATKQTKR